MVRAGQESDFDKLVAMSETFWANTMYDEDFCPDTCHRMLSLCLVQGLLSVVEIDGEPVGFACGIKGALLGNSQVSSGTELAWWVEPEHRGGRNGIALLKHLEGLARDAGIKYWNMIFMDSSMPEAVEGIYKKMGYRKSETVYTRVL